MRNIRTGKSFAPPKRNESQRIKAWDTVLEKCRDEAEALMNSGAEEAANLILMQLDGGTCFQCKKDWRMKTVDNEYIVGYYFEPSCDCYPRCPRCQRWCYEDREAGRMEDWRCPGCRWRLYVTDKDGNIHKRHGFAYEEKLSRMKRWPMD